MPKTESVAELLVSLESLLRECAQRFGNASMSKLSEKTASEMGRKCSNFLHKVENINNAISSHRSDMAEKTTEE